MLTALQKYRERLMYKNIFVAAKVINECTNFNLKAEAKGLQVV